jgi:hypothetical protein
LKSQQRNGSRPQLKKLHRPTAFERGKAHDLAIIWRSKWRKELEARAGIDGNVPIAATPRGSEDVERRALFASAIARSELGRHYWDARLALAANGAARRARNGARK